MTRYLALASAIVLAAIFVLLALPRPHAEPPRGAPYHGGSATPSRSGADSGTHAPESVGGVAPWALSVVPECFHQTASFRGSAAFARAHVPRDARAIAAGTRIRVADCVLEIEADSARLVRGDSRFLVPPRAAFYTSGAKLILDQTDGTHEEVRIYCRPLGALAGTHPLHGRVYSCK